MIETFTIFFLLIASVYVITGILMHIGLSKKHETNSVKKQVTILIAARNEEKLLPRCLESISNLEYPAQLMEVYVLNDHSDDNTVDIAQRYAKKYTHFHLINITETIPGLKGKMNALCQGIENTNNEIILVTDADCIIPPNWIDTYVSLFSTDTGLIGGMTLLTMGKKRESLFDKIQALDWIFLLSVASGTAGIGLPVTVLGNNFAFRRKAYEDVGGFRKIGFSVTEDMALLKEISKNTKWKIRYPLLKDNAIYSNPIKEISEFYHQRKRWAQGGINSSFWGYLLMSISFLTHLFILFTVIFATWDRLVGGLLIMLILVDASLVSRLLNRFRLKKLLWYFPLFEVFYIFYTTIFAAVFFLPLKINWKNRNY